MDKRVLKWNPKAMYLFLSCVDALFIWYGFTVFQSEHAYVLLFLAAIHGAVAYLLVGNIWLPTLIQLFVSFIEVYLLSHIGDQRIFEMYYVGVPSIMFITSISVSFLVQLLIKKIAPDYCENHFITTKMPSLTHKPWHIKYFPCAAIATAEILCFVALFINMLTVRWVTLSPNFAVLYLFPVVAMVYGVVSYITTRKIIVTTLPFIFVFLLIVLLTSVIGEALQGSIYSNFIIWGMGVAVYTLPSAIISVVAGGLTMLVDRLYAPCDGIEPYHAAED